MMIIGCPLTLARSNLRLYRFVWGGGGGGGGGGAEVEKSFFFNVYLFNGLNLQCIIKVVKYIS